ncbi:MAG: hypothetical protein Q9216_006089 [Gyalolechia sp. 2 TL-2023]
MDPLKLAGSEISGVTLGSSSSKKRRGFPRSTPRKRTHRIPQMHLEKPKKRKDDHVVARTSSIWLRSSDPESDFSGRPGMESVKDLNDITVRHGERKSISPTPATKSIDNRSGRSHPSRPATQSQGRPSSRDQRPRGQEASDTAYRYSITTKKDILAETKPYASRGRTPHIPIKIADVSDSETDAGVESSVGTWPDYPVEKSTSPHSDIKTQLVAVQSVSGSQNLDLADFVPTRSAHSRRVQHRKNVYKSVECDDGYAWGRECGLFSTVMGREDDEVEI